MTGGEVATGSNAEEGNVAETNEDDYDPELNAEEPKAASGATNANITSFFAGLFSGGRMTRKRFSKKRLSKKSHRKNRK